MKNKKYLLTELIDLLEIFVSGKDRSYDFANKINGIIIEHFYEEEMFEELMEVLAAYRPEGGEYLYNEKQALVCCKSMLQKIKKICLTAYSGENGQ